MRGALLRRHSRTESLLSSKMYVYLKGIKNELLRCVVDVLDTEGVALVYLLLIEAIGQP